MPRNRPQTAHARLVDPDGLIAAHESSASAFAEQGDWRSAYEHLRSALQHAREVPAPGADRRELERLRQESLTDALTGVRNRRYLDAVLPGMGSAALVMVDLDHFKHVNDRFGHDVGDRVLRLVAGILRRSLPSGAFCARYGGEEFVLAVPAISETGVAELAERARRRVEEFPWPGIRPGLGVTVSAGVALAGADPLTRLRIADELLYQAKCEGRNSVAVRGVVIAPWERTLSAHTSAPHS